MYPRSSFRFGGTCERTLAPVFVPGEHQNVPSFRFSFRGNIRQNHPFGNLPFNPRLSCDCLKPECTTLSHPQSLANFVANIHSQGISAARTIFAISFEETFAFASEFLRNAQLTTLFRLSRPLRSQVVWGVCPGKVRKKFWWRKYAGKFSGCVRIRIRIRSRIAVTAVHSAPQPPSYKIHQGNKAH